MRLIYTVSQLTKALKEIISSLGEVWVEGEVSNFRRPYTGHIYFTLKDEGSQIQCVIFKPLSLRMPFLPKDGVKVLVHGRLTVYEKGGYYEIRVDKVIPYGLGELQMALEALKRRLAAEGLFDPAHKKPLPKFPRKIGVVTSATGAAIRDIIRVISRRFPHVHIILHPVTVQGENAAREIAEAIETFNRLGNVDLLIVGRGGGSIEDLWAFNEEIVARSIFRSRIPIISAVGHEIDYTIADLVADVRAPTPSAAAEIAVPSAESLREQINHLTARLIRTMKMRLEVEREKLEKLSAKVSPERGLDMVGEMQQRVDLCYMRLVDLMRIRIEREKGRMSGLSARIRSVSPLRRVRERGAELGELIGRLRSAISAIVSLKRAELQKLAARLDALNPLAVLKRGYALCTDANGRPITRPDQVRVGDEILVKLHEGKLRCLVTGKGDGGEDNV